MGLTAHDTDGGLPSLQQDQAGHIQGHQLYQAAWADAMDAQIGEDRFNLLHKEWVLAYKRDTARGHPR